MLKNKNQECMKGKFELKSNFGSTNGVSLGRGYLFDWQMRGRVQETL